MPLKMHSLVPNSNCSRHTSLVSSRLRLVSFEKLRLSSLVTILMTHQSKIYLAFFGTQHVNNMSEEVPPLFLQLLGFGKEFGVELDLPHFVVVGMQSAGLFPLLSTVIFFALCHACVRACMHTAIIYLLPTLMRPLTVTSARQNNIRAVVCSQGHRVLCAADGDYVPCHLRLRA